MVIVIYIYINFNFINCGLQVTFNYVYVNKETGLPEGTNDQGGQDAYNAEKVKMEQSLTEVENGFKNVNWAEYHASSGLQLKDNDVANLNLGPVDAYCSEDGAVVKKCDDADINCFDPPCKCNKDTGSVTKCSK